MCAKKKQLLLYRPANANGRVHCCVSVSDLLTGNFYYYYYYRDPSFFKVFFSEFLMQIGFSYIAQAMNGH